MFAVSGADIRVRIRGVVVDIRIRKAAIRAVVRVTAKIRNSAPSALFCVVTFVEIVLISVVAKRDTVRERVPLP